MEFMIPLDVRSKTPLYEQIYGYICREIREGGIRAGARLPSTRDLAGQMKVSRSTAQMAYDQLMAEGYIESRPRRGYFAARMEELVKVETGGQALMETGEEKAPGCLVDFSPRGIDLDSFPYNTWRKLSRNTLVDDNREMFHAGNHQGEPGLREAIRSYLHSARGVSCSADQIIVGAGNEYLLMLLSQILGRDTSGAGIDGFSPVRRIAMENPTYKQAYLVLRSLGYPVCPVEMDRFGMDPALLEASGANVAYVMPSHQFPTGIVMPVGRRQELLRWAMAAPERFLIEDDYDSEFRYRGKPVPALQGMDPGGRVIYLGTFSKCIAPAIRVSYMVLPPALLNRYRANAGFYASTVSRIDQNILYQFLSQGYFERHLNRMRAIYRAKHDLLLAAIRPLEEQFSIRGEYAGIHILLTAKSSRTEEELIRSAAGAGVRVYGLSAYDIRGGEGPDSRMPAGEKPAGREPDGPGGPGTVILGYASLSEEKIGLGARILTECWGKG